MQQKLKTHRLEAMSIWASILAVISLGSEPTERFPSAGVDKASLTEPPRCSKSRILSRMLGRRISPPPPGDESSGTSTERLGVIIGVEEGGGIAAEFWLNDGV